MESRMRPAYATMVRVWLGNICLVSKDGIIHTSMLERPPVVLFKTPRLCVLEYIPGCGILIV